LLDGHDVRPFVKPQGGEACRVRLRTYDATTYPSQLSGERDKNLSRITTALGLSKHELAKQES